MTLTRDVGHVIGPRRDWLAGARWPPQPRLGAARLSGLERSDLGKRIAKLGVKNSVTWPQFAA